jgi:hypothetical protein
VYLLMQEEDKHEWSFVRDEMVDSTHRGHA